MRCFVGAFVAAESARRLQDALDGWFESAGRHGARHWRRVPLENLHLTLKFLGAIPPPAAAEALAAVAALEGHGVRATCTAVGGFPRSRAARLVAAELVPDGVLEDWWTELEARLGAEGRRFRPHVTLARRHRPGMARLQAFDEPLAVELLAPALYLSETLSEGARYRPVTEADLNDPATP